MSLRKHRIPIMVMAFALVFPLIAFGLGGCAPADPDEPVPEPESAPELEDEPVENDIEDDPLALTEAKCAGTCHDIDVIWDADYDEAGWRATIERMEDLGLSITEEETEIIVDYLISR